MNANLAQRLLITALPAVLLVAIAATTIWGDDGLTARDRLQADLAHKNADLAAMERDNQVLVRQLMLMDRDPVVLERVVADELEWARTDATLYRFEDDKAGE